MIADISQLKLHSEFFAELVKAYSPIKELKDGVVYVKTNNESNWNAAVCKVKDSFANCSMRSSWLIKYDIDVLPEELYPNKEPATSNLMGTESNIIMPIFLPDRMEQYYLVGSITDIEHLEPAASFMSIDAQNLIETCIPYALPTMEESNLQSVLKGIYDEKITHKADYEYDTGLCDTRGNRIYKLVPTVYILDSLAMLTPEKLTEEEELSGQMSTTGAAKTNTAVFKRIIPKLKAANIILFVINHINQKVEINPFAKTKAQVGWLKPDETMPGGNAAIYTANNLVRIDDSTKLKDSEGLGINGKIVDFTLVKTRTNNPGRSVPMVFTYDSGYDDILSLFVFLKSVGAIQSKGAYMNFAGSDIKFTQKGFKEKLYTDSEFAVEFNRVAYEELSKMLVKRIPNEEERKSKDSIISSIINIGMNH